MGLSAGICLLSTFQQYGFGEPKKSLGFAPGSKIKSNLDLKTVNVEDTSSVGIGDELVLNQLVIFVTGNTTIVDA